MNNEPQKTLKGPKKGPPRPLGLTAGATVFIAFAAISSVFGSFAASAQAVPFKIQAAIILKVLNYDRALKSRTSKTLRILVITDSETANRTAELTKAFSVISGQSVQGVTLEAELYELKDASKLSTDVASKKAGALYLPEGASASTFEAVEKLADKLPTFAGHAKLVEKGLAVGIGVENGKPKIVVNLAVMRRCGLDLSSTVLKLARVIK